MNEPAMARGRKQVRSWLSPPNPDTNLDTARDQHHQGTCAWFLQGAEFQEWTQGVCQHLWIRRIPGSGKTVLSSQVVATLLASKRHTSDSDIIMGSDSFPSSPMYFFFDSRDRDEQSLDSLLRSLISQLGSISKQAMTVLNTALEHDFANGDKKPSTKDLDVLFSGMLHPVTNQRARIILDALDESNSPDSMLSWVQSLAAKHQHVHILITSRDEMEIESSMRDWLEEKHFVSLTDQAIGRDITAFVDHAIHSDKSFKRWRNAPDIVDGMKAEIIKRANGM